MKQVTRQLLSTLWNQQLKSETITKISKTVVESIVTYEAEVWETTDHIYKEKIHFMEPATETRNNN